MDANLQTLRIRDSPLERCCGALANHAQGTLLSAEWRGSLAALTTSLPEEIGGIRNWDYRYCWVRDATLTLYAFMNAGHFEEAGAFSEWVLRAAAGAPDQMQIMYGVGGERRLTEIELPWLPG